MAGGAKGTQREMDLSEMRCNAGLTHQWVAVVCAGLLSVSAVAQTQPAESADSMQPLAMFNRAVWDLNRGRQAEALETLNSLLAAQPDYADALFLRAVVHGDIAFNNEGNPQLALSEYRQMSADLDRVIGLMKEPANILHLVDGVLQTKLSSYHPEESYPDRLAKARRALETYLNPPAESGLDAPTGLRRVLGRYFLGVVVYKLALHPPEARDAPQDLASPVRLQEAIGLLEPLVTESSELYIGKLIPPEEEEREQKLRRWLAFANMYMGLAKARQGNNEVENDRSRRGLALYDQASEYLRAAWREDIGAELPEDLGTLPADPGERRALYEQSNSSTQLPEIVISQLLALQVARASAPQPIEDFSLRLHSGFAYDTNVILLGDDTATPRDIGRKADVRFSSGLSLGYTLDLAKVRQELEGWTVGVQGRAAAVWNGDIHTYNEQDYGSSVALRYRFPQVSLFGREEGPLYLGIQHDYDYFLLGNNGFLRVNRVSPTAMLYTLDQRALTSVAFSFEDRNYLEELYSNRFDRDGNYFVLSLAQAFDAVEMSDFYACRGLEPWGLDGDPQGARIGPDGIEEQPADGDYARWLRPVVGVHYGWDSTQGQEFDAKRIALTAGIEVPLPYGVLFDFGADWEWQNYQGLRGGSLIDYHRRGRDDFIQRYRFGVERQFVLVPGHPSNRRTVKMDRVVMTLRGSIYFTDDDSNVEDRLGQEIFSYDRAVYGLSVAFDFN